MSEIHITTMKLAITRDSENPVHGDTAIHVEIDDEAAGPFIVLTPAIYRDGALNGYVGDPVSSYASLWTEINGPASWERNPWVWAVSFRRIDHLVDANKKVEVSP